MKYNAFQIEANIKEIVLLAMRLNVQVMKYIILMYTCILCDFSCFIEIMEMVKTITIHNEDDTKSVRHTIDSMVCYLAAA